jgi:hypothetical protein
MPGADQTDVALGNFQEHARRAEVDSKNPAGNVPRRCDTSAGPAAGYRRDRPATGYRRGRPTGG